MLTQLVSSAPPEQLDAALAHPALRGQLLDEIFRRMGSHVRSDKVRGMHAVVRWRLTDGSGDGGFDRYQCTLSDGACTVSKEMSEQPRVTITLSPADFVRLIAQQTSPAVLFVTGKLKVEGDLGFAAGLIGYFDLPT
ncbi:MAG: SCP2 sterol-binding domain-containing protein [Thermocrispum sp.]